MTTFLIIVLSVIFWAAVGSGKSSDYAAANKFLKQQKEFNMALHRKNMAMINEKTRRLYKDDPDSMKVYRLTGGMVVDKDKPVHIPEVRHEDFFK